MALNPYGFNDLVPILMAIDPTGDGQPALKTALAKPPRGQAFADIPFAYLTLNPNSTWSYSAFTNTSGMLKYSIKITLVLDLYDAGIGEPQNHDAILPWMKGLGRAFKNHIRLNDGAHSIFIKSRSGADDLVTGQVKLKAVEGITYVIMESTVDIEEVDYGIISNL